MPVCHLPVNSLSNNERIIVSSILDIVQQQLNGGALQQIAQHAGIDPNQAQRAVNAALPQILGGMAQHASQPGNAEAMHAQADRFAGAEGLLGNLGNLGSMFGGQGGGGILGSILGSRQNDIQNTVANSAGIDTGKAAQIIRMLAPMVMAALAQKKNQEGLAPQQVSSQLQQAQQEAQSR